VEKERAQNEKEKVMDDLFELLGKTSKEREPAKFKLIVATIDMTKLLANEEWMRRTLGDFDYERTVRVKATGTTEAAVAWTSYEMTS
jgi:hypothetical protein